MPLSSTVLAKIVNGLAIPLFVINSDHKITHWNTAIEALTGYKIEDVIGKDDHWKPFYKKKRPTMADLIVDGAPRHLIRKYYNGKFKPSALLDGSFEAEDFFPALRRKGTWLHSTASPILNDDGSLIGAVEMLLDTTQRKRLESNLRIYSQQITQAHEAERLRLARELHDGLSQVIGSASRQLDNLLRKNPEMGESQMAQLEDIREVLTEGSRELNIMIKNLRPPLLEDLGLIPALRSLCTALENTDGMITNFELKGYEARLDSETELLLFRIVQESLNNIRKHADATAMSLTVEFQGRRINIVVTDNGQGFRVPDSMDNLPRSGRLGLMGIQERIWLLGGTFDMHSVPGKGTRLTFVIPLRKSHFTGK